MSNQAEMTDSTLSVSLRGVSKAFAEGTRVKPVLHNVDLQVESGKAVAIRGRSGSGKSTLLNMIAGIDLPDAGSVCVCGVPLQTLSERERTLFRRRHLGFVYQSFNLIPTLTVADNIRLVLDLRGGPTRNSSNRVEELLDAVGLKDRAASFPDVLSGGEQQRVAVARALAGEPAVLIADEPTGNLDDENAEQVMELLDGLVRQQGSTLLIATHSARVAERCDSIVEMNGGQLQETPRA